MILIFYYKASQLALKPDLSLNNGDGRTHAKSCLLIKTKPRVTLVLSAYGRLRSSRFISSLLLFCLFRHCSNSSRMLCEPVYVHRVWVSVHTLQVFWLSVPFYGAIPCILWTCKFCAARRVVSFCGTPKPSNQILRTKGATSDPRRPLSFQYASRGPVVNMQAQNYPPHRSIFYIVMWN